MKAIRRAGLRLIYEHGYEAMNMRDLASQVGIQVGSLYHHINTKQELLFNLMRDHLEDLHSAAQNALEGIEGPMERMQAFVSFHITYHMHRRREVYISNFELRNLKPRNYRVIVALRGLHETLLNDILDEGVTVGIFCTPDTRVSTFAILAALTGICVWCRPNGRLNAQEIVDVHMKLICDGILSKK